MKLVSVGLLLCFVAITEQVRLYQTASNGRAQKFERTTLQKQKGTYHSNGTDDAIIVKVYRGTTRQTMYGYGAALTQSSAYMLSQLKAQDADSYNTVLNRLFNPSTDESNDASASLKVLRLPISSNEYSLGTTDSDFWSYDDTAGDYSLSDESLKESATYTIPVLKDILAVAPDLIIVATPWSAPVWLKTSAFNGTQGWVWGSLTDTYQAFSTYAAFLANVVSMYAAQGITIQYITLQSQPNVQRGDSPRMFMPSTDQIQLIDNFELTGCKAQVLIMDDDWSYEQYALDVLNGVQHPSSIPGTAFQCYSGSPTAMTDMHNKHGGHEIFVTECSGSGPSNYANLEWLTQNLYQGAPDNWATMINQYNIALDENDGPHNGGCQHCRPVVTINSKTFNVTYNEDFYGLAQYGKFVFPASTRWAKTDIVAPGDDPCDQNGGYFSAVSFWDSHSKGLSVTVANFCGNYLDRTVVIQTSDGYVEFDAINGLSTAFVFDT